MGLSSGELSGPLLGEGSQPAENLLVMNMFMALIVVMLSWVYAYLQTHKIVYSKYVRLLL